MTYTQAQEDEATETMLTAILEAVIDLDDDEVIDFGAALHQLGLSIGIRPERIVTIPVHVGYLVTIGELRRRTRLARASLACGEA